MSLFLKKSTLDIEGYGVTPYVIDYQRFTFCVLFYRAPQVFYVFPIYTHDFQAVTTHLFMFFIIYYYTIFIFLQTKDIIVWIIYV